MVSQIKVNEIIKQSGSSITIGESGDTVSVPSGATLSVSGTASGHNYPMFQAVRTSNQSTTSSSFTKIQFDTENFDTGGYFDNTTNYRFTPLVAGKYFVYVSVRIHDDANDLLQYGLKIEKNGTQIKENYNKGTANERGEVTMETIIDMNGSTDYLEFYSWQVAGSGNPTIVSDAGNKSASCGAYRLGA